MGARFAMKRLAKGTSMLDFLLDKTGFTIGITPGERQAPVTLAR